MSKEKTERESKSNKPSTNAPVFARNLKAIMTERRLTIRAVAEICKTSPSVVDQWLCGSMPTDPMRVLDLSKALKVNYQWLMTGTHPETHAIKDLNLAELFEEQETDLHGLYKIEAKKLVRKS